MGIGTIFALAIFAISGLANMYDAGRYRNRYINIRQGISSSTVCLISAILDGIAIYLLIVFP